MKTRVLHHDGAALDDDRPSTGSTCRATYATVTGEVNAGEGERS